MRQATTGQLAEIAPFELPPKIKEFIAQYGELCKQHGMQIEAKPTSDVLVGPGLPNLALMTTLTHVAMQNDEGYLYEHRNNIFEARFAPGIIATVCVRDRNAVLANWLFGKTDLRFVNGASMGFQYYWRDDSIGQTTAYEGSFGADHELHKLFTTLDIPEAAVNNYLRNLTTIWALRDRMPSSQADQAYPLVLQRNYKFGDYRDAILCTLTEYPHLRGCGRRK